MDSPSTIVVSPGPARLQLWRLARAGRGHLLPALLLSAVALWMMRAFLFSSALPAGTDMLGFIARARESSGPQLLSEWTSEGYGGLQTVTIDQVLGAITLATRNAVVTVKLVAFLVMAGAGFGVYLLSWRWFRFRSAALLAGALYPLSQVWLGQWAAGHLNVEVAFGLLPYGLLLMSIILEGASLWFAVLLGALTALLAAIRPDMVLYVVPTLAMYLIYRVIVSSPTWPLVKRAVIGCVVAVASAVALDMYQIVPLLAGFRASWASTGQLFGFQDLIHYSLPVLPSLLGFVQETGYLGFSGDQTSAGSPFLPLGVYLVSAGLMVVVSFAALAWRRDRNTVFLVFLAIVATIMASSVHTRLLGVYQDVVRAVPVIGDLRDPDRWLIMQALGCSALAGLTIRGLWVWMSGRQRRGTSALSGRAWNALAWLSPVALLLLLLLPVSPTVAAGLGAYSATDGQRSLLSMLQEDDPDFKVASVPYDTTYSFIDQPGFRGYEDDLGANSAAFTGDSTLGIGDWSTRGGDFVLYGGALLGDRDPAFERLLGTVGVRYVLDFAYPDSPAEVNTNSGGNPRELPDPYGQQELAGGDLGRRPAGRERQRQCRPAVVVRRARDPADQRRRRPRGLRRARRPGRSPRRESERLGRDDLG